MVVFSSADANSNGIYKERAVSANADMAIFY